MNFKVNAVLYLIDFDLIVHLVGYYKITKKSISESEITVWLDEEISSKNPYFKPSDYIYLGNL